MKNQYYLMSGVKNQPFNQIRVKIVDDQNGAEFVLVQCCDLRLPDCQTVICKRADLTPCDADGEAV